MPLGKDLVDRIRSAYEIGVNATMEPETKRGVDSVSGNLKRALECLSNELYSKDTHFLLEFIQNAEDNKFLSDVTPELRVELKDREIIISCNEVGFDAADVEAICQIGETKKKNSMGYIGEKGIGFKSIFKVADVVYVSSTQYTFKLDKSREPLGMITPVWTTKYPVVEGWTRFHLQLSTSVDLMNFVEHLESIHHTILLFLNKLRVLTIHLESLAIKPLTMIRFSKVNQKSNITTVTQTVNDRQDARKYFMVEHEVKTFQGEERRRGVQKSRIVLAFPLRDDETPFTEEEQFVYAFLPLRRYGFRFVIHADFLVSASREGILEDLPWNEKLREGIAEAFIQAVYEFQQHPQLKTTWFQYLPSKIVDPFFRFLETAVIDRLRHEALFRMPDNRRSAPSALIACTRDFCDDELAPLIDEAQLLQGCSYLPAEYDYASNHQFLQQLGVAEMSFDHFLAGLKQMTKKLLIRGRPNSWHENVCRVIMTQGWSRLDQFKTLHILPLCNGEWVTANANEVYFDLNIAGIPHDLDLKVLDADIEAGSYRYKLYKTLGARDADPATVAKKIMDIHIKGRFSKNPQSLIQQARFMFKYRHIRNFPPLVGFHVYDESKQVRRGDEVYMDVLSPLDLREILKSLARFLHKDYLQERGDEDPTMWQEWLRDTLKINVVPRLINGRLSPEFGALSKDLDTAQFLAILKGSWLHFPPKTRGTPLPFLSQLSNVMVSCENEDKIPLHDALLKTKTLQRFSGLPFLPIEDPEDLEWRFLCELGVTIEIDEGFFLKSLRNLRRTKSTDLNEIEEIYKQLEARFEGNAVGIRRAFENDNLIYCPRVKTRDAKWISLSEAVWTGHHSIPSKVALKGLYPRFSKLFLKHLQIVETSPQELVQAIKSLAKKWKKKAITPEVHKKISEMLLDLSESIEVCATLFNNLADESIFPVFHLNQVHLRPAAEFYLPDPPKILSELFCKEAPLLSLEGIRIHDIEPLLKFVDSKIRRLQHAVNRQVNARGHRRPVWGPEYADRINLVKSYLRGQPNWSEKQDILTRLRNVEVVSVESIFVTYRLGNVMHTRAESSWLDLEEPKSVVVLLSRQRPPPHRDYAICSELGPFLGLDSFTVHGLLCAPVSVARQYVVNFGIEPESEDEKNSDLETLVNDSKLQLDAAPIGPTSEVVSTKKSASEGVDASNAAVKSISSSQVRTEGAPIVQSELATHSVLPPEAQEAANARVLYASPAPHPRYQELPIAGEKMSLPPMASTPRSQGRYVSDETTTFSVQDVHQPQVPSSPGYSVSRSAAHRGHYPRAQVIPYPPESHVHRYPSPVSRPPTVYHEPDKTTSPKRTLPPVRDHHSDMASTHGPTHEVPLVQTTTMQKTFPAKSAVDYPFLPDRQTAPLHPVGQASQASDLTQSQLPIQESAVPSHSSDEANLGFPTRFAPKTDEDRQIGRAGELFVYHKLVKDLPDFGPNNWTSELRETAGFPPYKGPAIADFTYDDAQGVLTRYLFAQVNQWQNNWPTYHLEVKTTSYAIDQSFHMSASQLQKAIKIARENEQGITRDIYVILRVYDFRGPDPTKMMWYPDPLDCIRRGFMQIVSDVAISAVPQPEHVPDVERGMR